MAAPILEVKNIKVRYSGLPVLQGLSLSVNSGETLCVVGANGEQMADMIWIAHAPADSHRHEALIRQFVHLGKIRLAPVRRSMHACIESLKLDWLYVVYPGRETYAVRPCVEVMPLAQACERIAAHVRGNRSDPRSRSTR